MEIVFDCVDCAVVSCVDVEVTSIPNDFESVANDLDRRVSVIYLNVDISNFLVTVILTSVPAIFGTELANVMAIFPVFV